MKKERTRSIISFEVFVTRSKKAIAKRRAAKPPSSLVMFDLRK